MKKSYSSFSRVAENSADEEEVLLINFFLIKISIESIVIISILGGEGKVTRHRVTGNFSPLISIL